MTKRELRQGESERYYEFAAIDARLLWLVGPHSRLLFSAELDGPPDPKAMLSAHLLDWSASQAWRRALIEATGLVPRDIYDAR